MAHLQAQSKLEAEPESHFSPPLSSLQLNYFKIIIPPIL